MSNFNKSSEEALQATAAFSRDFDTTAASVAVDTTAASEEQVTYANILSIGTYIGLATMVTTFFLYVGKVLEPVIPIEQLPHFWKMKAHDYMKEAHLPQGWGWVNLVSHGDFINFIGIAFLAGLTIVAYLRIIPILIKKKDTPYVVMAVVEIAILVLAASGILTAGGH